MPNFALFIAIACALYAGNVSAGPVPYTNALLPQASNAFPSSASTFRALDPTNSSILKIDILPRDSVSSDPTNLYHHRAKDSLDRKDLVFRRDDSRSIPELRKHIAEQNAVFLNPFYQYNEKELRLAYDFLSSHAPYGAGLIQSVGSSVYKAKQIKQRYPKGYPSHHLQKTIDAAVRLLDLCQDLQSKTTLASATPDAKAEVDRAVEVLRKAIKTNTSEWEAKEATLQSSIVETMNSTVNLLKLLDESVGRGDESYLEERKKADLRATYAEYVCKHNDRLPKAAEAARHLLQFLAQTDKEANGTKRKAPEGDHEDVPTHGQKRTSM